MEQTFVITGNRSEFRNMLKGILEELMNERTERTGKETKRILSVSEAAEFLKLKVSTLYEKTAMRLIPHIKKNNRLYFYQDDLEEWLSNGRVKTKQELQGEAQTLVMNKAQVL